MYTAEVKHYDPDREYEAEFLTREDAEAWLRRQRASGECGMWLDGDRMAFIGGELVIDPAFGEKILEALRIPTKEELAGLFRPQPTRGKSPSNPATLIARGEL